MPMQLQRTASTWDAQALRTESAASDTALCLEADSPQATNTAELSDSYIHRELLQISSRVHVLPLAPKSLPQPSAIQVSDSEDDASWSVCSPRQSLRHQPPVHNLGLRRSGPAGPSGAPKRASDLLVPANSPCLPGAFPKPRASAPLLHVGGPVCPPPSHWDDRPGATPPRALPKPVPALRPRARSLVGPYLVSSLDAARRVPNRCLFSLLVPKQALSPCFVLPRRERLVRRHLGHRPLNLPQPRQP